jgi:NitT/TauT family transport system permease protein
MSFSSRTPNQSAESSPTTASTSRLNGALTKVAAAALAILLWQGLAMLLAQKLLLVSPVDVALRLTELVVTADFWGAVAFSLLRITLGFTLALIAGVILAVIAGNVRVVEILLWPYMAAVKATPVASFVILSLIWLGSRGLSVFIAFLMALPIIYTNVLHGIRGTDPKLLEMAKVFGIGRARRLFYIHIPHLKPYLLSACGVAIGLAWKAGVAAEVIGIPTGSIGERLYEAKVYFSSADLFAWTAVVVLLSILFEKLFVRLIKLAYIRMEKV